MEEKEFTIDLIQQDLKQQSLAILTINRQVNHFAAQIILKHENNRVILNPS